MTEERNTQRELSESCILSTTMTSCIYFFCEKKMQSSYRYLLHSQHKCISVGYICLQTRTMFLRGRVFADLIHAVPYFTVLIYYNVHRSTFY